MALVMGSVGFALLLSRSLPAAGGKESAPGTWKTNAEQFGWLQPTTPDFLPEARSELPWKLSMLLKNMENTSILQSGGPHRAVTNSMKAESCWALLVNLYKGFWKRDRTEEWNSAAKRNYQGHHQSLDVLENAIDTVAMTEVTRTSIGSNWQPSTLLTVGSSSQMEVYRCPLWTNFPVINSKWSSKCVVLLKRCRDTTLVLGSVSGLKMI